MVRLSRQTIVKGVGVYFAAAVGGYLYLRSAKAPAPSPCGCGKRAGKVDNSDSSREEPSAAPESQHANQQTFDRIADCYDSCINVDETVMGVKLMRWWLMTQAEGDVLEVSAGTGRNLPYYNLSRLRSLTLTDTSRHMLTNAADKYAAVRRPEGAAPVRFALADAQRLTAAPVSSSGHSSSSSSTTNSSSSSSLHYHSSSQNMAPAAPEQELPKQQQQPPTFRADAIAPSAPERLPLKEQQHFPPHSFDVVVDTFGLCSQDDPVTALKEMVRVCKPGGRILLLQHGKGTWGFINNILDNGAGEHFRKWGCWWNRDIERMVRQAGLHIESLSRWHFGTTYLIVARPDGNARESHWEQH